MSRNPFYKRYPKLFFFLIAAGAAALLMYFAWGKLPLYPCWLICLSVVTFMFYWYDKAQSETYGAWRIPEAVLHILSLMGGFVGAFIGRRVFRHKTQKIEFICVIVVAFCLHTALFLYF